MSANIEQRKLAAIMFTDMVGYSALSQRNEPLALALLEEHRAVLRTVFGRFNGTEIKTIGDAFLVEFQSALEAAQCAIEIQRTLAKRNHDVPAERCIELKIGIHIGDVMHRDGDVYGDGVNIASRIEPRAAPGGICVSMDVERQIRNALEARFEKLAPTELKNISMAMQLYRIVLPWEKKKGERKKEGRAPSLRFANLAWVAVIAMLAGGGGWWWVKHWSGKQAATPSRHIEWLAVLPLKNYSGDTNQEFFVDGMTDILNGELAQIGGLQVKSHTTSMRYKRSSKSIPEIGRELDVDAVVEGSVQRAGNHVLISVQLIEAATDRHLWAKKVDRDLTDALRMQSEVAEAIAREIKVRLTPREEARLAAARPVNSAALDAYLKAREHWYQFTPEGFQKALESGQTAIEIDPTFVPAHALIAGCYTAMANNEFLPPHVGFTKGREGITKALQLGETYEVIRADVGLKLFFDWDWPGVKKGVDRVLSLKPNDGLTHQLYSFYLTGLGPPYDEAMNHARRAVESEPMIPIVSVSVARVLYFSGKYEEAIREYRKIEALFPRFRHGQYGLGWAFLQNGQREQALEVFEKALEPRPVPVYLAGKAATLAQLDRKDEARTIAAQLTGLYEQSSRAQEHYVSPLHLSVAYAALGEKAMALAWLERAVAERSPFVWMLKVDPAFESIRSEPRFQKLLEKMKLTP